MTNEQIKILLELLADIMHQLTNIGDELYTFHEKDEVQHNWRIKNVEKREMYYGKIERACSEKESSNDGTRNT